MSRVPQDLETNLKRILSLNGSDEGFYVVALHALIESYANNVTGGLDDRQNFREKMDAMFLALGQDDPDGNDVPELAKRLTREHHITNQVRHRFRQLSVEEARTATYNFLEFCSTVGWSHRILDDLQESLSLWKGKKTPLSHLPAWLPSSRSVILARILHGRGAPSNS
jgi:hypothetical protein